MALRGKMQKYAECRAEGLEPIDAGLQAGYANSGIRVTVCRLEKRADIAAEIQRLQGGNELADDSANLGTEDWGLKDRYDNPLDLMLDVMNNPAAPRGLRYQAAKDAMPYCHARKEGGKKDEQKERAKKAAGGKFQTAARPSHLRAVG